MAYFCKTKPCEPNNVVIAQEKKTETVEAGIETKTQNGEKAVDCQALGKEKTEEQKTGVVKTVGPEFYLCEITAFYQQIITILFGVIAILLALSFAYVYFTSKKQAEEMARDALEEKSFNIILQNMIAKGADEFIDRYSGIPDLEARIEFLEEQINKQGYEFDEDTSEE